MIEGHSHLFLHPYNEAKWDDQVLHEPLALRTARAVVHAEKTLMAGFTTERDLGTEGAGYADVGLKQAINEGIIPGPRLLVVDQGQRRARRLRPQGLRARRSRAAGRRRDQRRRRDDPGRARPDRRGRRRHQDVRRLSLPSGRAEPADDDRGGDGGGGRGRARRRPARRGPRDHRRRDAPSDPRRSRHGRARLRRHGRNLQDDARPRHRLLPDASPRPRLTRATSRAGTGRNPRPKASRRTAAPSSWR